MQETLSTLIKKLKNCDCLENCYDILDEYCENIDSFQAIDLNLFKYRDIYIRTGKVFNLEVVAEVLKNIADLNLKTAPILVENILCKNNEDMVLITKINGCVNDLEKYLKLKNELDESSKNEILEDFDKLATKGIYNQAMLEGQSNWFVIVDTKKVYIDNWEQLNYFNENQEELRNNLLELLSF